MEKIYRVRPSSILRIEAKIFLILLLMNILSIAADSYFQTHHRSYYIDTYLVKLFYFDGEKNIPAYFSTLNLFLCALLSLVIYKTDPGRYARRWFYLGLIFIFLAFDELISIHEALTGPSRALVQKALGTQEIGVLYYAWIVPYVLLLIVAAVYFYKFVFSLPRTILINLIISAALFVTGAIGMEMVGGAIAERHGLASLYFKVSSSVEEALEMWGIILFARTLVQYLNLLPVRSVLRFDFNPGVEEKRQPMV